MFFRVLIRVGLSVPVRVVWKERRCRDVLCVGLHKGSQSSGVPKASVGSTF